jgi:hypothetical protein
MADDIEEITTTITKIPMKNIIFFFANLNPRFIASFLEKPCLPAGRYGFPEGDCVFFLAVAISF